MTQDLSVPVAGGTAPPGPHMGRWYADPKPYMDDRLGHLKAMLDAYGDIYCFRLAFWRVCVVHNVDNIRQVFLTDAARTEKSSVVHLGRLILGNGLLMSEGAFHRKQRRLVAPTFHRRRIAQYVEAMGRQSELLMDGWRDGDHVDMHAEMMKVALAIIGETMFGADVAHEARAVNACLESVFNMLNRLTNPLEGLLTFLPLPSNARLVWSRWKLHRIVQRMIDERRNSSEARDDLLSMLLEARDEEDDGAGMNDAQVRAELLILFIAGHETTANALSWTWYLLSQHPDIEARLQAELAEALGGRTPRMEDLPQLPYTRMVIEESMRLYPPAYVIDRSVVEPIQLGPYRIEKGMTLFMSPYLMHHDARYYPDPERFDPERWRPEEKEKRPKHVYFPFGIGTRSCIGEQFAWSEAIVVLATIAQRFRAELSPEAVVEPYPLVTLRPRYGMPMILRARQAASAPK